jgi:hypothetical protein
MSRSRLAVSIGRRFRNNFWCSLFIMPQPMTRPAILLQSSAIAMSYVQRRTFHAVTVITYLHGYVYRSILL